MHVRADRRGHGIGTALIEALVERARSRGVHTMIAGVDAQNEASLRLHERLGFVECARIPEVGVQVGPVARPRLPGADPVVAGRRSRAALAALGGGRRIVSSGMKTCASGPIESA